MGNESTMDAMSPIDIKKEQRLAPTFVNLKSNTMKNTMQRYGYFGNLQDILFILQVETMLFNIERHPVYSYLQNRMPSL